MVAEQLLLRFAVNLAISTGVLLLSMFAVSRLMKEKDPDRAMIRDAVPRLALLLVVVALVGAIPGVGLFLTLVIWLPGLMLALKIPLPAAILLTLVNWVIGSLLTVLLIYAEVLQS